MISSILFAAVLQILAVHPANGGGNMLTMRDAVASGVYSPGMKSWHWEGDELKR